MIFPKTVKHFNSPLGAILVALVCVTVLPLIASLLPVIRFAEETIDVEIFPDEILVRGLYAFRNPFPFALSQTFAYPVPENVDLLEAYDVKVKKVSPEKEPLSFTDTLGSRRFKLRFPPKETVAIEIEYRQKTPKRYGRYIPITLHHRNQPLQFGSYALIPKGVEIVSSSYPLQKNGKGIHYYEGHRFIPSNQWRFSWRVRNDHDHDPALLTRNESWKDGPDLSDYDRQEEFGPLASFRAP